VGDRGLVEPSAVLRQAAKGLHEMFVALVNEGFSETQAMHILGVMLAAQTGGRADGG